MQLNYGGRSIYTRRKTVRANASTSTKKLKVHNEDFNANYEHGCRVINSLPVFFVISQCQLFLYAFDRCNKPGAFIKKNVAEKYLNTGSETL